MAGIYVHVPFCSSRCVYCGFYSTTGLALRERYVDALCQEIKMRSLPTTPPQKEGSLGTIYLGGGTPSQLTIPQLRRIFDAIYIYNKVENDAEVTIEVNPDDVTPELAAALQQLQIVSYALISSLNILHKYLSFLRRSNLAPSRIPEYQHRPDVRLSQPDT